MRYRLVAAAAAVVTMCATPGAGAAQDPRPPAAPSAAPLPAPAAAATVDGAGVPVFANGATPWDIYLACRAPDARTVPALAKLCALRLPAISRSFTGTELGEWRDAASSLPLPSAIVAARDNAERALLNAARRLGTASVGTGEFPFERGRDTLPSTMQALLAKQAADAKHTFDADSQAVDVLGFADYSGNTPSPATQALAERRAEYVAGFLRRAGIPADRINIRVQLVRNPQGTEEVGERFRKASVGGASTALVRPPAEGGRRAFGLSPAEMAVGASNFLVERAQAELETYLLRVGVNRICATESWRALLRATCALLPQDADTVRYVPGAGALQGALRADLREMPYVVTETTLLKIVVHADSVARARSVPAGPALERAALAVALVRYLRAVADGTEPLAALARWEGATATLGGHTVTLPPRLRQVATIARFSWSARTDLSSQLSGRALADTAVLYVLKALLVHGASATHDNLWAGWATADAQRVNAVLGGVRTALAVAHEVEDDWRSLRSAARDSASTARRTEIVSGLISTATSLLAVDVGIAGVRPDPVLRDSVLEPARDLVVALTSDDPRGAVNSLVRLLQAGAQGQVVRIPQEYTRILGFANDAAQARTTDEFSGALENLAGPQGGYLSKREIGGRWYARLNAYVGGNVSGENTSGGAAEGQGLAVGITVPIGVEIGTAGRTRRSNGVFLQFLDLGAVASARLAGNDDVESLPDFKLGTLVGPGVFWAHGYRDSPLTSAIGVAYFPEGRHTADGDRVGVVRASVMIAIDIPLFP